MPLSKEKIEQIRKGAGNYHSGLPDLLSFDEKGNAEIGYLIGAGVEAEKAQVLIEALQLWQTYDTRIHNLIDVAKFHMEGLQALSQYKSE